MLCPTSRLGWEHITITGTYHWNGMAWTGLEDDCNLSGGPPSSF